ncbi:MAG TPA: VIT1/CCC1 transporter family protein [bacterium]|nr:VIT1/CCC1 transporter family protein [bacterium]
MPLPLPHHHHHHAEAHTGSSAALRDFVIGISDGLTVPFALAAGLSGAVPSNNIIVIAGLAEIVAGTISMGLGGYLAGRTEIEHYEGEQKREAREVREIPHKEEEEVKEILAAYGLSPAVQSQVASELSRDHEKWVDFMMRFELGLEKPDPRAAFLSALRIGLSYAAGGLIPLSAYFFLPTPVEGLKVSALLTLACLLVFGYFKARFTGQNPFKGAVTVTLIGLAAAGAAFGLARLFNP